jgi:hypothetical protein
LPTALATTEPTAEPTKQPTTSPSTGTPTDSPTASSTEPPVDSTNPTLVSFAFEFVNEGTTAKISLTFSEEILLSTFLVGDFEFLSEASQDAEFVVRLSGGISSSRVKALDTVDIITIENSDTIEFTVPVNAFEGTTIGQATESTYISIPPGASTSDLAGNPIAPIIKAAALQGSIIVGNIPTAFPTSTPAPTPTLAIRYDCERTRSANPTSEGDVSFMTSQVISGVTVDDFNAESTTNAFVRAAIESVGEGAENVTVSIFCVREGASPNSLFVEYYVIFQVPAIREAQEVLNDAVDNLETAINSGNFTKNLNEAAEEEGAESLMDTIAEEDPDITCDSCGDSTSSASSNHVSDAVSTEIYVSTGVAFGVLALLLALLYWKNKKEKGAKVYITNDNDANLEVLRVIAASHGMEFRDIANTYGNPTDHRQFGGMAIELMRPDDGHSAKPKKASVDEDDEHLRNRWELAREVSVNPRVNVDFEGFGGGWNTYEGDDTHDDEGDEGDEMEEGFATPKSMRSVGPRTPRNERRMVARGDPSPRADTSRGASVGVSRQTSGEYSSPYVININDIDALNKALPNDILKSSSRDNPTDDAHGSPVSRHQRRMQPRKIHVDNGSK